MTDLRRHDRPDDGALVRVLDGQATEEEARGAQASPASADRLWELRQAARRLTEVVDSVDVPELPAYRPTPRPTRTATSADASHATDVRRARAAASPARRPRAPVSVRAASVALLLSAGALAAMPATRQAIVALAGSLMTGGESAPTVTPARTTVTIPVAPEGFFIEIAARQAAGDVVIERHEGPGVSAEADGTTELLVLPTGIVVRNAPGDRGDVILRVPESMGEVPVRIGGESIPGALPAGAESARIPLAAGSR